MLKIRQFFIFLIALLIAAELLMQAGHLVVLLQRELRAKNDLRNISNAELRILCVGESTTEWGGEDSYPNLLKKKLEELMPDKKINIINGGKAASDTTKLSAQLPMLLTRTQPNIVIFMMGINDSLSTPLLSELSWRSKWQKWLFWSRVWRLGDLIYVNFFLDRLRSSDLVSINPLHQYNPEIALPVSAEAEKEFQSGLAAINEKKWDRARDKFRSYLAIHSRSYDYYRLGNAYYWQSNSGELLSETGFYLEKAYALDPTHLNTLWLLSGYLAKIPAQKNRAKKIAQNAIKMGALHADLFGHLADFALAENKREESMAFVKLGLEKSRHTTRLYLYVRGLKECESDKSILEKEYCKKIWESAMEEFPKNPLLLSFSPISNNSEQQLWMQLRDLRNYAMNPITIINYRKMAEIAQQAGAKVIAMQYPTLPIEPLEKILKGTPEIVFIENQSNFAAALKSKSYSDLFSDNFAISFGHATKAGNELIAEKLATEIKNLSAK